MSETHNRIDATFTALRGAGQTAMVAFISAGDPTLAATAPMMSALAEGGAHVIELGVPFSDPVADGPVIQRASQRALAQGATLAGILEAVRTFRQTWQTPVLLFGYINPFLAYGLDRLVADAVEAGVDGFLVVDLPPEEAGEFRALLDARALRLILLVSPNTTEARVAEIAAQASGFIYYVALKGVTGAALTDLASVAEGVARVKSKTDLPVCVGFGISSPADAEGIGALADGIVVGSAIVSRVEEHGEAAPAQVRELVSTLAGALRGAPPASA